jgi:hypothetical protein
MAKKYLNNRSTAAYFGRKDRGWPWRQKKRDPNFPDPDLYLNGGPLWAEETLEAYAARLREARGAKTS